MALQRHMKSLDFKTPKPKYKIISYKESVMSIVKVIEVICEGVSVEEALKSGVKEAAKTVKNIRQINIEHIEALVEKNKITKFRVNAKISFIVDHAID